MVLIGHCGSIARHNLCGFQKTRDNSFLIRMWMLLLYARLYTICQLGAKPLTYFVCSKPNTPTPSFVPTYTLPFATIGVMNLFPAPK
jgi:hypothetical protein